MSSEEASIIPRQEISPEDSKLAFGINASLTNAFKIGEQTFGVFKIPPDNKNCFPSAPNRLVSSPFIIMQLGEQMKVEQDKYKGLREGEIVVIGRSSDQSDRFTLDPTVSRRHVEISLHNGEVNIHDLGSKNGTLNVFDQVANLAKQEKQQKEYHQTIFEIQKQLPATNAKRVLPYELTREPDNSGKPVNQQYVRNQQMVRALFVDSLTNGSLYTPNNPDNFVRSLKRAHQHANSDDVYARVGEGNLGVQPGEFRSETGSLRNKRTVQAQEISKLASRYHDPYAGRFSETNAPPAKFISMEFLITISL